MIALVLAAALAQGAARPPDGTYYYTLTRQGVMIGSSEIVFKTLPAALTVQERADLGSLQATTMTSLDAATLNETAYGGVSPQQGSFGATFTKDSLTINSGSTRIPLQESGGLPMLLSDGLVSSLALLPAIVHATGKASFTIAAINGAKSYPASVSTSNVPLPSDVPKTDAAMTLTYAGGAVTLWYDPKTFVLDLARNAATSFEIRRTSYTAQATLSPMANPTPVPLPAPQYVSRDVSFPASLGATLAGTLTIPKGARGPLPIVVTVPGSGAQDRNEQIGPNRVFLQLANMLSNHGYIVLRYDKRGVGSSVGKGNADLRKYAVSDADAAFHFARTLPQVDKRRIYLLGHSEGAMSVPIIAASEPGVRGIILLGAPAMPLDKVMDEQLGVTDSISVPQFTTFIKSWSNYIPAETIAHVRCPILIVQGGKDKQVLAADLPTLVNAAKSAGRDITVRTIPNDDHIFLRLPDDQKSTGEEYFQPGYLDPAVFEAILSWLAHH